MLVLWDVRLDDCIVSTFSLQGQFWSSTFCRLASVIKVLWHYVCFFSGRESLKGIGTILGSGASATFKGAVGGVLIELLLISAPSIFLQNSKGDLITDTTLLVHFFGTKGRDTLKYDDFFRYVFYQYLCNVSLG